MPCFPFLPRIVLCEAFSAGQFMLETNTGWQGFKKRAGRPLSHVTVLFKTYSSFSHLLLRPSRPGRSRLQFCPHMKNINSWRPRCWNRSQPLIWVNSCEGQCLPMCNKAAQTLLQHPAFCGICYLRWGFEVFGHVYTARGGAALYFSHSSRKWITKKYNL